MGVKNLSKFINQYCKNIIKSIHLSELNNKTIAIDISIYLYKYKIRDNADGTSNKYMLRNFKRMIDILKKNSITPIFVFDAKTTPEEKKKTSLLRKQTRMKSKKKYLLLSKELRSCKDTVKRRQLISKMNKLKPELVQITDKDILDIKSYFENNNIKFYQANKEADIICAMLVNKNKADAVLSEDSDMFVYGAHKIIKCLNLKSETVKLYETQNILNSLKISLDDFQTIAIISGTDYNPDNKLNIYTIFEYYNNYHLERHNRNSNTFVTWLQEHKGVNVDIKLINNIRSMYNIVDKQLYII